MKYEGMKRKKLVFNMKSKNKKRKKILVVLCAMHVCKKKNTTEKERKKMMCTEAGNVLWSVIRKERIKEQHRGEEKK